MNKPNFEEWVSRTFTNKPKGTRSNPTNYSYEDMLVACRHWYEAGIKMQQKQTLQKIKHLIDKSEGDFDFLKFLIKDEF